MCRNFLHPVQTPGHHSCSGLTLSKNQTGNLSTKITWRGSEPVKFYANKCTKKHDTNQQNIIKTDKKL